MRRSCPCVPSPAVLLSFPRRIAADGVADCSRHHPLAVSDLVRLPRPACAAWLHRLLARVLLSLWLYLLLPGRARPTNPSCRAHEPRLSHLLYGTYDMYCWSRSPCKVGLDIYGRSFSLDCAPAPTMSQTPSR
jgi:hypothetical protein